MPVSEPIEMIMEALRGQLTPAENANHCDEITHNEILEAITPIVKGTVDKDDLTEAMTMLGFQYRLKYSKIEKLHHVWLVKKQTL